MLFTGTCFLYLANNIDDLLPETGKPDIVKLVCVFFTAKVMAATQDIVVDGWALTMLKKFVLLSTYQKKRNSIKSMCFEE